MMTEAELLEIAKKEMFNLKVGETFLLKDLFKGYEWNRIEQGVRSKLGTSFLVFATSQENIEIISNVSGQRRYRKIN